MISVIRSYPFALLATAKEDVPYTLYPNYI